MTTFYVGQRVKLVYAYRPENYGLEGFIRELFDEEEIIDPDSGMIGKINCHVDWENGSRDGNEKDGFDGYGTHTDQIEPITRLDNTATTWDEMPCARNGKFKGIPA